MSTKGDEPVGATNNGFITLISSDTLVGVTLAGNVAITKVAGGTISGNGLAVIESQSQGAIVNAGVIGAATYGAYLPSGGLVTNAAGGVIEGTSIGVKIAGGSGTVQTAGTIIGDGGVAVTLAAGYTNSVSIAPGAVFTGTVDGGNTVGSTAVSTLDLVSAVSAGTLTGLGSKYIDFAHVTVDSGATWTLVSDSVGAGTYIYDSGTLTNTGGIFSKVSLYTDAVLSNAASGTISPASFGVGASGTPATVINAGYIHSGGIAAIDLNGSGVEVTNQSGGRITGIFAVRVVGTPGTVVNAGYMEGANSGAFLKYGTGLSNASGGTIVGTSYGVYNAGSGAVINADYVHGGFGVRLSGGGSLINASSGTIFGVSYGVNVDTAAGTVVDAGTISGSSGALRFENGYANRLIVDPGAVFVGGVLGGAGALELASGSGTLAGLGGQFSDFVQTTIDVGASWNLSGTLGATYTLTNDGTLALTNATLIDSGTLVNDGGIVLDPSTLSASNLTGTGSVTIEAGGVLDALGTVGSGQTISFSGGYLHLYQPTIATGGVVNFGLGDTIDLKGIAPASVGYSAGTLSFTGGAFRLDIVPGNTLVTSASADGTELTAFCFCAGTRIRTTRGLVPVERLREGMRVPTRISGTDAPIVWIGRRTLNCRRHPNPECVWPVRIAAGAFGAGVPVRDLWLSPDHAVFIDDVLIPAKHLIDAEGVIVQVPTDDVTYYHVALSRHDVLLAEGLPVESYLDTGSRANFANSSGPVVLHPDFASREWEAAGCAPLVVSGPILERVRRRIAQVRPGAATRTEDNARKRR